MMSYCEKGFFENLFISCFFKKLDNLMQIPSFFPPLQDFQSDLLNTCFEHTDFLGSAIS